jgi:hypothetical protein
MRLPSFFSSIFAGAKKDEWREKENKCVSGASEARCPVLIPHQELLSPRRPASLRA